MSPKVIKAKNQYNPIKLTLSQFKASKAKKSTAFLQTKQIFNFMKNNKKQTESEYSIFQSKLKAI
jgi:hypothetical protein